MSKGSMVATDRGFGTGKYELSHDKDAPNLADGQGWARAGAGDAECRIRGN